MFFIFMTVLFGLLFRLSPFQTVQKKNLFVTAFQNHSHIGHQAIHRFAKMFQYPVAGIDAFLTHDGSPCKRRLYRNENSCHYNIERGHYKLNIEKPDLSTMTSQYRQPRCPLPDDH